MGEILSYKKWLTSSSSIEEESDSSGTPQSGSEKSTNTVSPGVAINPILINAINTINAAFPDVALASGSGDEVMIDGTSLSDKNTRIKLDNVLVELMKGKKYDTSTLRLGAMNQYDNPSTYGKGKGYILSLVSNNKTNDGNKCILTNVDVWNYAEIRKLRGEVIEDPVDSTTGGTPVATSTSSKYKMGVYYSVFDIDNTINNANGAARLKFKVISGDSANVYNKNKELLGEVNVAEDRVKFTPISNKGFDISNTKLGITLSTYIKNSNAAVAKPVQLNTKVSIRRDHFDINNSEHIADLQARLISSGESLPIHGSDGIWGAETLAAVKSFQEKNGITASGIVKKDTLDALGGFEGGISGENKTANNVKGSHIGNGVDMVNYLTQKGLTKAQASGIVGNLYVESSFNPNALGDNGTSFGLAQWHNNRWDRLKRYAKQNNSSPDNIETQLDYLMWELRNKEHTAMSALKNANTPYDAAYAFAKHFERPKEISSKRMSAAEQIYKTA